jgi:coenzyme F420 hydrogenase subunit beta
MREEKNVNAGATTTSRPTGLRILPDEAPLRGGAGPMGAPLEWPPVAEHEVPRTLRTLARIVDGGLCHRCGSCVGICPTSVLSCDGEEYPTVTNLSACTDCQLCVKVCPGDEFGADHFYQSIFGVASDHNDTHGHFIDQGIAYATDARIREGSTSGGLVTAILLDLLERGEIDGAVTIQSDERELWRGRPMIARTAEELMGAMKSKYAIAPTNTLLAEIREKPGRYAVVGLPCQIHGVRKAAELDERIQSRVVLTIGLFCHAAIEHDAYAVLWETLGDKARRARRFISRIGKHPGTPYLELDDGSLYPVYFGERAEGYRPTSIEMINILYRLYTPERCLTCYDATAEFADIAVGDPWMAPPEDAVKFSEGWSFALVRSSYAREVCRRMVDEGKLGFLDVTRREALACNSLMAGEKRWRAFRVIETRRRQGKPIPAYGFETPRHSPSHFIKTEIHMWSHLFCCLPRWRGVVLRFILSPVGYWLLWMNFQRRQFRFWRRDIVSRVRRRLWGRR